MDLRGPALPASAKGGTSGTGRIELCTPVGRKVQIGGAENLSELHENPERTSSRLCMVILRSCATASAVAVGSRHPRKRVVALDEMMEHGHGNVADDQRGE